MAENWIVVVDDDAVSLKLVRSLLSEQNMRVNAVRSGRELLKFMENHDPDLILLDIQMPELDGFETYKLLREGEAERGQRQTPVVFLTGEESSETERRGLELGASDFIHKPFDLDILLQRIEKTIQNSKTIENLEEEAAVDGLTGFQNKANGAAKAEELCQTEDGAVMVLDLDNFKLVNDLYGHDMGDQVLRAFADIIRSCMRDDDLLCRSGGDEFMLFCRDMQGESDTAALIGRINERFRAAAAELMGEDYGIPLGVSAGVVFVPAAGRDYQTLFVYADKALYRAKNNGKHGYSVYNPGELAVSVESEDPAKELLRVTQVIEERGEIGDAMLLGQDAFSWVYRFVLRYLKRYRGAALKLLFILTADSDEDLNAASEQFGDLLKQILRRSDIITQSKRNQFFLLLPELQEQNAPVVIERILSTWEMSKSKEGIRINYAIESIDYTEED